MDDQIAVLRRVAGSPQARGTIATRTDVADVLLAFGPGVDLDAPSTAVLTAARGRLRAESKRRRGLSRRRQAAFVAPLPLLAAAPPEPGRPRGVIARTLDRIRRWCRGWVPRRGLGRSATLGRAGWGYPLDPDAGGVPSQPSRA
jgi:hypothetical protein